MKDMDFNLANNTKKTKESEIIVDEYDEEDEEIEETPSTSSSSSLNKNQMTKVMFLVIGAIVVIFLLIILVMALFQKSYTYEDIETVMIQAAESYFKNNPESLPTGSSSVEISAGELSSAGYMKPLEEYVPEGSICSGSVNVQKSGSNYLYTPKLDCGDSYATMPLYRKVQEDNKIVSSGYGLYNKAGNKVFRGEVVNNYIQLDKVLWRIVKITSSGEMVLITDEYEAFPLAWDDRYNQSVQYSSGINTYSASRIRESINHIYELPEDSEETELLLSNADKAKLVSYNLCTGKRSADELGTDNASECREVLKDQIIGLLTVSDYMAASTDVNCKTATSAACQNYNYLVDSQEWWTVTAIKENTYQAYIVDTDGDLEIQNVNLYANLRPVVHLNSKVLYKSGDGSKENPYMVK